MLVLAGSTANFTVSYDNTLATGLALANAVLVNCEGDYATLINLFGGITPSPATLPFQISLVPGAGGASHPGCLATNITCLSTNSDTTGLPATVMAEVAEVMMAVQGQFNCGFSNGEALSRVLATVLYPTLRWRFSTGN